MLPCNKESFSPHQDRHYTGSHCFNSHHLIRFIYVYFTASFKSPLPLCVWLRACPVPYCWTLQSLVPNTWGIQKESSCLIIPFNILSVQEVAKYIYM